MRAIYIDVNPMLGEIYERIGDEIFPGLEMHRGDPTPESLPGLMSGCQGVMMGRTPLPRVVLEACPALRQIVFLGTGIATYVDLDYAKARGIGAHSIAGYASITIAEHTIGLMFAATRQIIPNDRALRSGIWRRVPGLELRGKTLGVVGAGNVGREVIRLGAALGLHVLVYARSRVDPQLPCRQVDLAALLERSDIVTLHLAHTPETHELINRDRLALMRPNAVLINTARGSLIDEQALVEALQERRIAHAALDVFDVEPLPHDHPFIGLENTTLTAHNAWNSPEAAERLMRLALAKLRDELQENLRAASD